jgi:phenylacetate-coenzyme A ligase PaaK-like adenylate-forming protein
MGVINKLRLLRQVRKNQWLKTSELEELQTKKLRAIIKHAYDNTEFYHRKFKDAGIRPEDIKTAEDIKKVPFTSKAELRKNGMGSMLTSGLDFRRSTIVQTSGSTGMPLKVVYDRATEDFGLPLMKCVEGRKDDFIYLPSGKIISPMLLEWVMEYFHGIIEYQIVQDTIEKISLYLVISEEFEDSYIDKHKHKHNLQNALNNEITVDVKIRNKLNRSSGNKLRAVISKIDVNI